MVDSHLLHKRWISLAVIGALTVLIVLVFGRVLELRFSSGEVYPHYSSLRSDPLGTRAFYESLQRMEGFSVSRNLRPLDRIENIPSGTTLFMLGVPRASLAWLFVDEKDPVIEAVREGARLVIAVNPGLVPRTEKQSEIEWWQRHQRIRRARRGDSGSSEEVPTDSSLLAYFDAGIEVPPSFDRPDGGWELINASDQLSMALPDWYSHCRLTDLGKEWQVIGLLADSQLPVVAERNYGKGSVVVTSDAYFASNEALWQGADSEFLLWLIGDHRRVIFDESIHGAQQTTGVMQWIRRYRLHGFFAGLSVFVVLLAWRSGSSLIPKRQAAEAGSAVMIGEAAEEGLVRLLKRGVKPGSMLRRCVELWMGAQTATGGSDPRQQEIEVMADQAANPVEGYREIVAMLRRRRS